MIRAIFACDSTGGIGRHGTIPWPKNTEDLKWFKETTTGEIVMMGRKTWDDPMMPKPLPNRYNIVVSDREVIHGPNMIVKRADVEKYLNMFRDINKDVWIIGGGLLLSATVSMCDEIWISRISGDYDCDTRITIPDSFTWHNTHVSEVRGLQIEKYKNATVS
jgi:dihydrofolate reductase